MIMTPVAIETPLSIPLIATPSLPFDDVIASIARRIEVLQLDLSGLRVVTEAATGPYAVTAVIAAMAGAEKVYAVARGSPKYGSYVDAVTATLTLADRAGVAHRIIPMPEPLPEVLATCDILTNAGHLRPITHTVIDRLPRRAVIALMFEDWEFRAADLDLAACRKRKIRVAAVNERHPDVGVFPFLGPLCVKLLSDAGVSLPGARIALLCDNPFSLFIEAGLMRAEANISLFSEVADVTSYRWDAVVVALNPATNAELSGAELAGLAEAARGATIVQFWGDIDRQAAAGLGFGKVWPTVAPSKGHMGILFSALSHEPVIRLQAGGLRAAELVVRNADLAPGGIATLV